MSIQKISGLTSNSGLAAMDKKKMHQHMALPQELAMDTAKFSVAKRGDDCGVSIASIDAGACIATGNGHM